MGGVVAKEDQEKIHHDDQEQRQQENREQRQQEDQEPYLDSLGDRIYGHMPDPQSQHVGCLVEGRVGRDGDQHLSHLRREQ